MAYWEFLLQREGDRDWLPLETAHVEISEGRYRIIAHSSYQATPVSICLSQVLTDPTPPKRKTLKRVGQTNENGLMVVLPFTPLTPGSWTVSCRAIAPTPWEYGVQLQVLASAAGMDYWDTDLDEAAIAAHIDAAADPAPADLGSHAPAPPSPPPDNLPDHLSLEDLPLRLQLQHQALVAQAAMPVILQGQVTTLSEVEGLPAAGTLWLQLRNPETGAVVHQATQSLTLTTLPRRFDWPLALPAGIPTRLVVGELSLWTASDPPQVLAIQGFTITLNLDAVLEVIANQGERSPEASFENLATASTEAEAAAPEAAATTTAVAADRGILPPLAPREIPFRLIYLPTTGLTLPPVIYRPLDKKVVGAPSLPPVGGTSPAPEDAPAPPRPAKPLSLPLLDPSAPAASEPTPAVANTDAPRSSPELPTWGRVVPTDPAVPAPPPAPAPFQPDFQGRFWQRLSALAAEAQKAAADQKAQLAAAGVELPRDGADTQNLAGEPADSAAPTPRNYEVVVYDLNEEPEAIAASTDTVAAVPQVEVLAPGEPDVADWGAIPMPDLVLPQGDLVAGEALPITVRLPAYPRRLAVKVWLTDLQSRTLVDRPRWLMNWTPTADGEQTAFLQLQVPLGSLEVRFAAIAIDLATQRESYKTTSNRAIVPANLPAVDFDPSL